MKQFRGGVLKSRNKIITILLSVLCAAVFFCGFFAIKSTSKTNPVDALTSSTISSATKIGNGADLWDSTNKKFNATVTNDLSAKLFDNEDALTYIQANYDKTEYGRYDDSKAKVYVVPASKINESIADTTKRNYGYIIKLGGLDWMITSLTIAEIDGKADQPVLTLYLADSLTKADNSTLVTSIISTANNRSHKGDNMYSSSVLRTNMIKGTGDYSKLALFTDTSSGSFATKYLVQPKNIAYQRQQTMKGREKPWSVERNWGSEALEEPAKGEWASGYAYSPSDMVNNIRYDAWGEDYIWIPSFTEMGMKDYLPTSCIWQLSNEQRVISSGTAWMRSGYPDYYNYLSLVTTTAAYSETTTPNSCYVRPAIHLNLKEVLGLEEPEVKGTYTYNGAGQDLRAEKWYNISVFDNDSLCKVKYMTAAGNEVELPKAAGDYKIVITLNEGIDYYWSGDRSDRVRSANFTINKKALKVNFSYDKDVDNYPRASFNTEDYKPIDGETVGIDLTYYERGKTTPLSAPPVHRGLYTVTATITDKNYTLVNEKNEAVESVSYDFEKFAQRVDLPEWFDGYNEATYATVASGRYPFELDLDSSVFELSVPKEFQKDLSAGGILIDDDNVITVTQAGEYKVLVSIKDDTGDTLWRDSDDHDPREVTFTLNPATYSLDFSSGNTIMVGLEQNTTVTVFAASPWADDKILITLKSKRGNSTRTLASNVKFSSENEAGTYSVELNTSNLTQGEYTLEATWDNTNYEVVLPSDGVSIIVSPEAATASVTWDLRNSKTQINRLTSTAETATFANQIPYDGQVYYVNASPSLGFTLNRSYNEGDFKNGVKTVNASGEAVQNTKDAGVYTTTVCLRATATGEQSFYSVTYEIVKAKINLGEVKWQNNGKMPYTGTEQTCELEGLPEGVTAVYAGAQSGTDAKVIGRIDVSLSLSEEAERNYYEPDSDDPETYEGDFNWYIEWEIVPLTIPLNWKIEGLRDASGSLYNGYVLKNGGTFIKYYYYETDSSGNILDEDAPLEEITVPKDKIKYFKAKATIAENYRQNYKLAEEEEKCFSNFFEVGRTVAEVQVAPSKADGKYTYWGSPVAFQFRVTKGAIDTSYFDITYFNGYTQLSGAPTNVGSYRAEISLKNTYRNSYSLQGDKSFEFEIVRATIEINWNEAAKPPMLTLNSAEVKAVEYEYIDANSNPIQFSGLQRGNEYAVRAVIKDTLNYIFEGNQTVTDWKGFSISATETPVDPTNPTNPFYPTDKPVDPNESDNSEKTHIEIDLATLTVSYNGYNQPVSIVCNDLTAEEIQEAFIVRYFTQENQEVLSPSAAGVYRVVVSLSGAYSANYVIDGDTSFIYTILGGSGNTDDPTKDPNGGGDNPSGGTFMTYLPVILSGVSLLLIVTFLIMTFNNLSAAKAAREKTKKLAQMSYSVSPLGLLAAGAFGLSQTNWWIIAGALMGLALIMAIVAFMAKGKKKRALAALEEEKERIEEEKEMARIEREEMLREEQRREMREEQARIREEQARRDNEMKMMFAAMQQGYQQPQMNYGDMQNMIASTISALLPAMQQQMALPPAQSDPNAYGAQQNPYGANPNPYGAQQNPYGANQSGFGSNPEADALRAQLAAQQEQMARQQELLNQILQNQQVQPAAQYYEEEPVDDTSWLGESDDVVSLEESYGNLDDNGKRAYYELGSYIMSKYGVSQNDGRYAVLFKYRGRTVFKLAIRDDAPVLYYPSGGGRAEVSVFDSSSLDLAKSMIDRVLASVEG